MNRLPAVAAALFLLPATLPSAHAQTAPAAPALADMPPPTQPAAGDASASRNAALSRLRECGHQWSAMKKTGAANGMTWKDFSQVCLAKQ